MTAILLLLAVCICLTGCKNSPTLTEVVYDDEIQDIDPDTDQSELQNTENSTVRDENIPPKENNDSAANPRDRVHTDPQPGNQSNGSAPDVNYRAGANAGREARSGSAGGSSGNRSGSASSNDGSGGTGNGGSVPGAGGGGEHQVVDPGGSMEEIPQNADTVSAVGEAAGLVCMLGGSEKLTASSQSLRDGLAGTVLQTSDCSFLWSEKGQQPLSDSDFQTLMERRPSVCIEISGQNTFSEVQIQSLKDAGITYTVLPSLTSGSNICEAVQILGQILGGDAASRAEEYLQFYQRLMRDVSSKTDIYSPDGINYDTGEEDSSLAENSGVYALYLNAWDSSASYTLHDDAYVSLEGTGLPIAVTGYTVSPVTWFLSAAGVANTSALRENSYSIRSPQYRYVNPVVSSNKALTVTGNGAAKYDKRYVLTTAGGVNLGQPQFSTVIVPNETMKQELQNSPLWKNYGLTQSLSGLTSGYGFLDQNGDIVQTTIQGDYDICVLPNGVGSWGEGSAESVLTSVWAAWRIRGVMSESEVKSYIGDFYSRFYGYELSNSQMDRILQGKNQ